MKVSKFDKNLKRSFVFLAYSTSDWSVKMRHWGFWVMGYQLKSKKTFDSYLQLCKSFQILFIPQVCLQSWYKFRSNLQISKITMIYTWQISKAFCAVGAPVLKSFAIWNPITTHPAADARKPVTLEKISAAAKNVSHLDTIAGTSSADAAASSARTSSTFAPAPQKWKTSANYLQVELK